MNTPPMPAPPIPRQCVFYYKPWGWWRVSNWFVSPGYAMIESIKAINGVTEKSLISLERLAERRMFDSVEDAEKAFSNTIHIAPEPSAKVEPWTYTPS